MPGVRGLLAGGQGQSLVVVCLPLAWRVSQKPQDLGVAPYPRFGNLKSFLKNGYFPSAVPFPCWPGRRKRPPHALSVASVLGPALRLVLLCSPRGGATHLPVSRTEVQPKYSSKGQSSFSFHLELCDGAGRCREDRDIFKALFSCPNNPSCRSVSTQAQGASQGGGGAFAACPGGRCS